MFTTYCAPPSPVNSNATFAFTSAAFSGKNTLGMACMISATVAILASLREVAQV
jgi:hypothetical protein